MKPLTEGRFSAVQCLLLSLLSALLMSFGWQTVSGFTTLLGLVPLLMISNNYSGSVRDTLKVCGWASLTFVLWHLSTIWWVWNAAAIGTIAGTIIGSWWMLLPFTLYHIVSKRMPQGIAYTLLVAAWIACEQIYINAPALSFPWLTLGGSFAFDTWAVQWYEYTGVLGGSLWVWSINILIFEALKSRSVARWCAVAFGVVAPLTLSLVLYGINSPKGVKYSARESVLCSAIQPNVDCYEKFNGGEAEQQRDLVRLLTQTPAEATFVLMPETALATTVNERFIGATRIVQAINTQQKLRGSKGMVIAGTSSIMAYGTRRKSDTNRRNAAGSYYDIFNSSIGITADPKNIPLHHKGKLVVGVETLPAWFREGGLFGVDLGGVSGQLGIGSSARPFEQSGVRIAPAICYEGLYGHYMGEFVRNGAQIFGVVSNDGWWGDTPGYKYLFAFCRLRAIEHRRDVVRSANTGISGFINARGDVISCLEWDKKGVITAELKVNNDKTFYTRYGDYLGRVSLYVALLCILYTVAVLSKKRFYLD